MCDRYSHIIALGKITKTGFLWQENLDDAARQTLALHIGLSGVSSILVDILLQAKTKKREVVRVTGSINAVVQLECVASMAMFDASLQTKIDTTYLPQAQWELRQDDLADFEPITQDGIDIGDLVAQYLALEVPIFPRDPGFVLGAAESSDVGTSKTSKISPARVSPFEKLRALRKDSS